MPPLLALRLLADFVAAAYVPLLLLLGLLGLLAYFDQNMVPHLTAIAAQREWPAAARALYLFLHNRS